MTTFQLPPRVAIVSRGVRAIPTLPALLDDTRLLQGAALGSEPFDAVLAWGRKPSADAARAFAARHGVPTLQLEDGFLRSVGLGDRDPPLSLVLDDLGIYYDAGGPSRLEQLVLACCPVGGADRAIALAAAWRDQRVSKYNGAREPATAPPEASVLVIDQTWGDASIRTGSGDAHSFARMLEAALDEHPGQEILLKVHPDVLAGRKRGHFDRLTPGQAARVRVWSDDVPPASLLERAAAVYTVTSQMGFEALLWERPVRCFGMPFYAGWGLTADALAAPARRRPATLPDLVHAALIAYPRYLDPESGRRCEPERLVQYFGLQRRLRERFPAEVHALRFSRWKKPVVRAYFDGSEVRFHRNERSVPAGATAVVWGHKPAPPQAGGVVRLEDGFLRSVGLGAALVLPLSWVMDRRGMYYACAEPSGLEELLAGTRFDAELLARARALRERILAGRITKYNVGEGSWTRPPQARRVLLVPGQVESDASIALGSPQLRSNLALLQAVRAGNPDAYVLYKPHPDVVDGLRQAGSQESEAVAICDEVVTGVPIEDLFAKVDEVHTLTSLSGFEALLRGLPVTVYGQPFYAGWGLTDDRCPIARRQRRLTLDELVAATLILYPTYVSRRTGRFTTPEHVLDELEEWRVHGATGMSGWRRARRAVVGGALRLATRLGLRS
ncbi:MAG TPA: capsular polysaccharide biosynthesis protein [Ramlibacter sp.]|jgi:capsular polysaccharide export protein